MTVRVTHVIAPSPAGGAESVLVALASAAKDRTRAIIISTAPVPPEPVTATLRERGVHADEVRCGRRAYRAETTAITRLLQESGAQIVHTHGYHASWVAWPAARRLGIPAVATVHGYLTRSLRERFYNIVDRRLMRRFHAVIAVSQPIHDQLVASGVPASRVHLVQNGLSGSTSALSRSEARARLGLAPEDRAVGWMGRLSPEKGADLFLEALSQLAGVKGVIVGEGPERDRLMPMVRAYQLEGKVYFAGFLRDAASLLPAFDALALTSRTEGTPMVLLEALAAGVPVVSFRVGGVPHLLGEDGAWLVAPLDVPALREALREALRNPEEARRRVTTAHNRLADRLSIERWVEKVEAVYRVALEPDAAKG